MAHPAHPSHPASTLREPGRFIVRAIATCGGAAYFAVPVAAQDASGQALASYALEFCAAVVDGEPLAAAHAATSARAQLRGPQPVGDDVDLVGPFIAGDRETLVFVLGPPDDEPRLLMAYVRADASHCVVHAGRADNSLATLYARLAENGSPWKEEAAVASTQPGVFGRDFSRSARSGGAELRMFAMSDRGTQSASVAVERSDAIVRQLGAEQLRTWATTVVSQCAAGAHRATALTAEAFAPFFEAAEAQREGRTLEAAPGHPPGQMSLNPRADLVCVLVVGPGGAAELERAIVDALVAGGATAQKDGTYRVRKPQRATGRDATFRFDHSQRTLLIAVTTR